MMRATVIHLLRHGKTFANEQRLYCGQTNLGLSDAGVAALLDLKGQGIYLARADLYFTTGLLRTEQTLDLLYGPVQRRPIAGLMEYHFGSFEMKSHEELKGQQNYQAWLEDKTGLAACPGGESKRDFAKRMSEGFNELLTHAAQKSVLLICHGGVIAHFMEQNFPAKNNFYGWQPQPGRGYTITIESDGQRRCEQI